MSNQKLEKLLEYQIKDIELKKIKDELERDPNNERQNKAKAEFYAARAKSVEIDGLSEKIVSFATKADAYYANVSTKIKDLAEAMKSDDESVVKDAVSQIEKTLKDLTDLQDKIKVRVEKANEVINSYKDTQSRGEKLRNIYKKAKADFEITQEEKKPKIDELTNLLAKMSKDVDAELFKTYVSITKDGTYPAFVEAREDDRKHYSCHCGLSLSQEAENELKTNGFCKCENCRRVIYKKQ